MDLAAAIVTQKDEKRWLIVRRPDVDATYAWNIDDNSGWHHISNEHTRTKHRNVMMVSLNPYKTYILGSESKEYGISTENFWVYNPESYRFSDLKRFTQGYHAWGHWTTAKKSFRAFTNCNAERTYVAVGWGGNDWVRTKKFNYRNF